MLNFCIVVRIVAEMGCDKAVNGRFSFDTIFYQTNVVISYFAAFERCKDFVVAKRLYPTVGRYVV